MDFPFDTAGLTSVDIDRFGAVFTLLKNKFSIELTGEIDFDLVENTSTVTGNAKLRWIGSTGSTRHVITEDASGNLLIDPAVSAGNNKVKIDG